ncbi:MAG TPA: DUF6174 domain-containing protein [Nocardioides sp.]|nr:DUF6174 domain-containing protein [Nocardioides sp.]
MGTALVAAVAATFVLSACGSDGGDTAIDPGTGPTTRPTAEPTVGTYPSYAPTDYAYTLRVTCFCADANVPIRVQVVAGEVASAVYAHDGRGHDRGDPADDYRRLTINDVIDAANDTDAYSVQVEWPAAQDHPDSVYVDQDDHMIDEEVGYAISDVDVG